MPFVLVQFLKTEEEEAFKPSNSMQEYNTNERQQLVKSHLQSCVVLYFSFPDGFPKHEKEKQRQSYLTYQQYDAY